MNRKPIGYKDHYGREIFTWDIVQYYIKCDAFQVVGVSPRKRKGWIECVSIVREITEKPFFKLHGWEPKPNFYFYLPGVGAVYAFEYAKNCRIVGKFPNDKQMVEKSATYPLSEGWENEI